MVTERLKLPEIVGEEIEGEVIVGEDIAGEVIVGEDIVGEVALTTAPLPVSDALSTAVPPELTCSGLPAVRPVTFMLVRGMLDSLSL